VWFVMGNCERGRDAVERVFTGSKVRLLYDRSVTIEVKDRRITLCGVQLSTLASGHRRAVDELQTAAGDADIRVLVAHYPDAVLELDGKSRVDLVVAGHTHGGQVQVPLFGPPITLSSVPRSIAAGGLGHHRGNAIWVSRGVGCERGQSPRMRFLCPPEVSIVTLGDAR